MPITTDKLFKVDISSDKLRATITPATGEIPDSVTANTILEQLKEMRIVVDEETETRAQAFLDARRTDENSAAVFIIEGKAPVPDKPGSIDILWPDPEHHEPADRDEEHEDHDSFYDRSTIIVAKEDQELLRLIQPEPGESGIDIYGNEIPRKLACEIKVQLGANVRQDHDTIYATCDGKVEYSNDKIAVAPQLVVPGDVDFSVGNINFPLDVEIAKNVLDLFKVCSGATITINGVAEGAEIRAKKNLNALGGIAGKHKGYCRAGGNVNSKYISNGNVKADGDIEVNREIVQSQVLCKGQLKIENGSLIGGESTALGGAVIKTLGSDGKVKTILEAGVDRELCQKVKKVEPEIRKRRGNAQKVRQVVEPLLQNQRYLSPEQKEKATELMYQASELEDSVDELLEEVRAHYEANRDHLVEKVAVRDVVYPGTIIRFPRVEVAIQETLSGPITIEPRKQNGMLHIVAIDDNSSSVHDLGGQMWDPDLWRHVDNLLQNDNEAK